VLDALQSRADDIYAAARELDTETDQRRKKRASLVVEMLRAVRPPEALGQPQASNIETGRRSPENRPKRCDLYL